jgi:hypothetical protein
VAATGGSWRLGVDAGDLVPGSDERLQHRNGKLRCSQKG